MTNQKGKSEEQFPQNLLVRSVIALCSFYQLFDLHSVGGSLLYVTELQQQI